MTQVSSRRTRREIYLGVAFNFHDSAVAFVENDEVALVLEAERVFRTKKMAAGPGEIQELIGMGLRQLGADLAEVSQVGVVSFNNPWLEPDLAAAAYAEPVITELHLGSWRARATVVSHHFAHASAFFLSDFRSAAILTCDSGGDLGQMHGAYLGDDCVLEPLGYLCDAMTSRPYHELASYLFGRPHCEGSLMALSAFGSADHREARRVAELVPALCHVRGPEGPEILERAFPGLGGVGATDPLRCAHLAAGLQATFVSRRQQDCERLLAATGQRELVLVGGAALNLEANTAAAAVADHTFVPPCCDDTGQALGAAAYVSTRERRSRLRFRSPYLGRGGDLRFTEPDIEQAVDALAAGRVLLVHNGRSEVGPRALGHRSFIFRADDEALKRHVSERVKGRAWFRPIAPVVRQEDVDALCVGPVESPYMLFSYRARPAGRAALGHGVHHDGTARLQTVGPDDDSYLRRLLDCFGDRTGTAVLLNTSLNRRGEPLADLFEQTAAIAEVTAWPHVVVHDGRCLPGP
jgi:carbamoyltransferase